MSFLMKSAYVEISNVCNLKCSFCPSVSVKDRQWMTESLFSAVLEALMGNVQEIFLHVLGEPLMHPQLGRFLEMSRQHGLPVNVTTNGTLLGGMEAMLFGSPALRQINFSLHALEEIVPKEEALIYVESILAFCKEALQQRPDLYVNLRLWNEGNVSSRSWNAFIRERISQCFGVEVISSEFQVRHKSWNLCGRIYLHSDSRFVWPGDNTGMKPRQRGTCHALDTHCAILADGRVVPCCLDYQGKLVLGKLPEDDFVKILAGPRAVAMREGFANKELVEPFCQQCPFCVRFPV
jgi:hypothetical protein